nr:amino acid deaminase [Gemmatimonadota bacterium]NIR78158.1 amino acid deaminase [Gemmatimonadota bacterium]NIT86725.1 amino acid deaminase [Gemmatimonadota bacterium]NIU30583.1 amino acid deaminase [Gemmatimonadota bacterium]NIU35408.1 amino acid deaminase [Gemmatimonadota bacterium]
ELTARIEEEGLFAEGEVILSAGGSAFFDLVAKRFAEAGLDRCLRPVVRSGCYLTHDSSMYREEFERVVERTPEAAELGEGLRPALEVWAYVQSLPEPGRAILTAGKRDVSFDYGLPEPERWYRSGEHDGPRELGEGYAVVALNDQHAYLDVPGDTPLRVGDMVALGISHPCATFDRWQLLPLVNADYDVVGAVRTFF